MSELTDSESGGTVAVFAAPDAMTAEIVRGMLQSEGIEAVVGEQVTGAYEGAFAVGEGHWGELRVRPEDLEKAKALIDTFEASGSDVSEEELDATAQATSDPRV